MNDLKVETGRGFGACAPPFSGEVAADESADEFVNESHAITLVGSKGEEGGNFIWVSSFVAIFVNGGSGREGLALSLELLDAAHCDGRSGPIDNDRESIRILGWESPRVRVGAKSRMLAKERNDFG